MYTILVVEDDPSICCNIELILQMEGFTVRTAHDGNSGLASLQQGCPDLILCDILMPDLDGHLFLETVKNDPAYASIPFIFVTALGDRADIRRGMSSGADDYLTKPFSADELVSAVTGRLHRLATLRLHGINSPFLEERSALRLISAREREVLLMVGRGATSKEIAEQLDISLRTVEVHRSNLMRKLNAANAAILARWSVIAEQMQP